MHTISPQMHYHQSPKPLRGKYALTKGIKAEDVKNLPPIEEIHGLNTPKQVVEVNSLYRFDEGDIPHNKSASKCLDELIILLLNKRTSMLMLVDN